MNQPFSVENILSKMLTTGFETLKFTDRGAGVACPACRQDLVIANLDDLKVAACHECNGILIESDVLSSTIREQRSSYRGADSVPVPVDPRELAVGRACPSCGDDFATHPYYGPGNAVIDSCMYCRLVWLDQGELSDIIKAPGKRD